MGKKAVGRSKLTLSDLTSIFECLSLIFLLQPFFFVVRLVPSVHEISDYQLISIFDYNEDPYTYEWFARAEVAWSYFQPGVGVNPTTGLLRGTTEWLIFTDWDLGIYISAILDAEILGLIPQEGKWGSNDRLEKIFTFLENRTLTNNLLPCAEYTDEGQVPSYIKKSQSCHPSDVGNLLLALNRVKQCHPEFATRIDAIVARHNIALFAQDNYFAGHNVYPFYAAQGYQAFGYSISQLLNLEVLSNGPSVNVCGVDLPRAWITSEPLLLAITDNRTNDLYKIYADNVFMAQMNRYEQTGKLTAFSEGAYFEPYYFVYEWIVTGRGDTWTIRASDGRRVNGDEIIFTKVAFAFHAIYNNTYTALLVDLVSPLYTEKGFLAGITENGSTLDVLSSETNGMVLKAARYAITQYALLDG